jgi:hypothetical protein
MKKAILILGTALMLAGCNKEQGGTTDQYGTDRGTSSTMSNNAPSSTLPTNSSDTANPSGTGTGTSGTKTNTSSNNP